MSKLISCEFNFDTACVELLYQDTTRTYIDGTSVESEITGNRFKRGELDYLIYNDPLAYVDLIFNGDPELH